MRFVRRWSRIQLATDLLRRGAPIHHQALFDDIDGYIEDINELTRRLSCCRRNVMDNSFFELVKVRADLAEYCLDRFVIRN